MRKRYVAAAVIPLLALLAAVFLLSLGFGGCGGGGKEEAGDEYRQGYEDGVKAERAKWSEAKLQLARTMIKEQEDSQENVERLLKGEVSEVKVGEITMEGDKARVRIQAVFTDGTVIDGHVDLVKLDGMWYMEKVTSEKGATPS